MKIRMAALAALLSAPALATNGYFAHGYGTPYVGMAGAGCAIPLNTIAPATNPAADAFLTGYDVSLGLFSPDRDYTVTGAPSGYPGTFGLTPIKGESSEGKLFYMPNLGANWRLSDAVTVGVAIYGNGGMNTSYDTSVFYAGRTGVDLSQLFVAPTVTYTVAKDHAFGVSPILAYQRFQAEGLLSLSAFSSDPQHLSNNGYDQSLGFGARVGYLGKLAPWLNVGASYQTRISMGKLKEYAGLFAEQGGFDIPSNWTVGVALMPNEKLAIALDVQQIYFSEVKSVGNGMLPNLMTARLGAAGGAGFGWKDVTAYKLGLQYAAGRDWTLRAGYSYAKQPVPETEVLFNILAPGVVQHHITAGVSRAIGKSSLLHVSVMYALGKEITGPNPLEAPGQQTISLSMNEWMLDLGLSFGF